MISGKPMSAELRTALERAKGHKMTPRDMFLQKVSFVYGQAWDCPKSKREIAEFLAETEGYPREWVDGVPE